jgi:hypothetical protein
MTHHYHHIKDKNYYYLTACLDTDGHVTEASGNHGKASRSHQQIPLGGVRPIYRSHQIPGRSAGWVRVWLYLGSFRNLGSALLGSRDLGLITRRLVITIPCWAGYVVQPYSS